MGRAVGKACRARRTVRGAGSRDPGRGSSSPRRGRRDDREPLPPVPAGPPGTSSMARDGELGQAPGGSRLPGGSGRNCSVRASTWTESQRNGYRPQHRRSWPWVYHLVAIHKASSRTPRSVISSLVPRQRIGAGRAASAAVGLVAFRRFCTGKKLRIRRGHHEWAAGDAARSPAWLERYRAISEPISPNVNHQSPELNSFRMVEN
jgi:hypothetical protein